MTRFAFALAALHLVAPSMPRGKTAVYAGAIAAWADRTHQDPVLIVALVEHESRWRKGAISKDKEDYGLGQIRARFLPPCARDRNPVRKPSRRCRALQSRLLRDPLFNLRTTLSIADQWMDACKTNSSSLAMEGWLTGYAAGRCSGPVPKAAREILDLRRQLRSRLALPPP